MRIDRGTVLIVLAAFAVGFVLSNNPLSTPRPDRPVMRWIARAAKSLLWVAAFAEKAPSQPEQHYIVHARVGEDGHPLLDHGRGW